MTLLLSLVLFWLPLAAIGAGVAVVVHKLYTLLSDASRVGKDCRA